MRKIGRNDPCICGSGVKYKRCCLSNDPKEPRLPGPRLQEQKVLSLLLEQSSVFQYFYHAERRKLAQRLIWIDGSNLRGDIKASATYIENGTLWIQVRWCPIPSDEFQVVMHEMMHCVLWSEGYPLLVGQLDDEVFHELITHVNTTLHDPLVEQRLTKYGINPWTDFDQVQQRTLDKLTKWEVEEVDLLPMKLFYGIIYAEQVLDHRVATSNMNPIPPNLIAKRLTALAPLLKIYGEEVLDIIDSYGFETPQKMGKLLEVLHSHYGLGEYIKIKYPS